MKSVLSCTNFGCEFGSPVSVVALVAWLPLVCLRQQLYALVRVEGFYHQERSRISWITSSECHSSRLRLVHRRGVPRCLIASQKVWGHLKIMLPTLVFAIASLYLLVYSLLHFSLQYSGSCRFVEACNFQNMGCIYPVIASPAHDMITSDLEFVHRHITVRGGVYVAFRHDQGFVGLR